MQSTLNSLLELQLEDGMDKQAPGILQAQVCWALWVTPAASCSLPTLHSQIQGFLG